MTPEFSRPERLDAIGGEPRTVRISADEGERQGVARRFGLVAIAALDAEFAVHREGADVLVTGRVKAAVTQACAVSGEPIAAVIDEPVALRFVAKMDDAEEIELDASALDTLPIEGGAVDLGEAAAETLALALDPFPRAPDADEALAAIKAQGNGGTFAALAGLRDKLKS